MCSDCKAICRLHGDCAVIVKRCAVIPQRLHSDRKAIGKRLGRESKAIAERLQSDCVAILQR
jgi:hypothetical protein